MDKILKELHAWQEASFAAGVNSFTVATYNKLEGASCDKLISVTICLKGDESEGDLLYQVIGDDYGKEQIESRMDKIFNFIKHLL